MIQKDNIQVYWRLLISQESETKSLQIDISIEFKIQNKNHPNKKNLLIDICNSPQITKIIKILLIGLEATSCHKFGYNFFF